MTPVIPDEQPTLYERDLWPGASFKRWYKPEDWETHHPRGTPHHSILNIINVGAAVSVTYVRKASTSLIGPTEGTQSPADLASSVKGPAVGVNGGFYLHWGGFFFVENEGGPLMGEGKYGYLIGESSLKRHHVPLSATYAPYLLRRTFSDGTYLTIGPSLNAPLSIPRTKYTEVNLRRGRFCYFATDHKGDRIRSVVHEAREEWDVRYQEALRMQAQHIGPSMKTEIEILKTIGQTISIVEGKFVYAAGPPSNKYVRCQWHRVPATLSHANEPNERTGQTIYQDGGVMLCAYTSIRELGLTINQFRDLIIQINVYFGLNFFAIKEGMVWANDGGPSVVQLLVPAEGAIEILAKGGEPVQRFPISLGEEFRPIPNMIVISSCP